jgi:hypothetical protein
MLRMDQNRVQHLSEFSIINYGETFLKRQLDRTKSRF